MGQIVVAYDIGTEGDKVTARAAVSVRRRKGDKPTFGAIWMTARVSTDRNDRTLH